MDVDGSWRLIVSISGLSLRPSLRRSVEPLYLLGQHKSKRFPNQSSQQY